MARLKKTVLLLHHVLKIAKDFGRGGGSIKYIKNLNIDLVPEILPSRVSSTELPTYLHKNMCAKIFIGALLEKMEKK